MRYVVVVLALLAAVKIATQEYMFRTSAREVIVSAYRDRALLACQRDARTTPFAAMANIFGRPGDIKLTIGKSDLDVFLWQVDHHLWNARYRNPYLLVTAGDRTTSLMCEYDVVHDAALIFQT